MCPEATEEKAQKAEEMGSFDFSVFLVSQTEEHGLKEHGRVSQGPSRKDHTSRGQRLGGAGVPQGHHLPA